MRHGTSVLYGTAIALAVGVVWFSGSMVFETPSTNDPVFFREVIGYQTEEGVVGYQYKGEKVPEKITPDEDVSKRTESSYTRLLEEPDTNGRRLHQAVIYAQPTYVREGSEWYFIEHATTTETAFEEKRRQKPLAALFWKEAYAASVAPFSEAGDGDITMSDAGDIIGWSDCTASGIGTSVSATAITMVVRSVDNLSFPGGEPLYSCTIRRGFLPFITSAIPAGSVITAATLSVYVTAKTDTANDGLDYLTVVQTSQATHTTLATSDFGSVSGEGIATGERKDVTGVATSAYLVFTLNATGRSWIKASGVDSPCSATNGITCLGIMEGHDFSESSPGSGGNQVQVTLSTSEQTGTSQDPFLTVTYSSGSAFWQFQDF